MNTSITIIINLLNLIYIYIKYYIPKIFAMLLVLTDKIADFGILQTIY